MAQIDASKVRAMNAAGMNDYQIAEALGCSRHGVRFCRMRNGIPALRQGRPFGLADLTEDEFRAAMKRRKSMRGAAAVLQVSFETLSAKARREGWM